MCANAHTGSSVMGEREEMNARFASLHIGYAAGYSHLRRQPLNGAEFRFMVSRQLTWFHQEPAAPLPVGLSASLRLLAEDRPPFSLCVVEPGGGTLRRATHGSLHNEGLFAKWNINQWFQMDSASADWPQVLGNKAQ